MHNAFPQGGVRVPGVAMESATWPAGSLGANNSGGNGRKPGVRCESGGSGTVPLGYTLEASVILLTKASQINLKIENKTFWYVND